MMGLLLVLSAFPAGSGITTPSPQRGGVCALPSRLSHTARPTSTCLTTGVDALPSDVKAIVIRRVATFSDFTADNDPHGEHDFGSFSVAGRKFFFKLDYYDATMTRGSEDPADPAKTTRVLTIMLASEY
jgi:hypothetical protein